MAETNAAAFAAAHGGTTFVLFYTVKGNGTAFGKCVSLDSAIPSADGRRAHPVQEGAGLACTTVRSARYFGF